MGAVCIAHLCRYVRTIADLSPALTPRTTRRNDGVLSDKISACVRSLAPAPGQGHIIPFYILPVPAPRLTGLVCANRLFELPQTQNIMLFEILDNSKFLATKILTSGAAVLCRILTSMGMTLWLLRRAQFGADDDVASRVLDSLSRSLQLMTDASELTHSIFASISSRRRWETVSA